MISATQDLEDYFKDIDSARKDELTNRDIRIRQGIVLYIECCGSNSVRIREPFCDKSKRTSVFEQQAPVAGFSTSVEFAHQSRRRMKSNLKIEL